MLHEINRRSHCSHRLLSREGGCCNHLQISLLRRSLRKRQRSNKKDLHRLSFPTKPPPPETQYSSQNDIFQPGIAFALLQVGETRNATLMPTAIAGLSSPWEISQKHFCFPRITHALWHLSAAINLPVYVDRPATLFASPTSTSLGRELNRCRPPHQFAIIEEVLGVSRYCPDNGSTYTSRGGMQAPKRADSCKDNPPNLY